MTKWWVVFLFLAVVMLPFRDFIAFPVRFLIVAGLLICTAWLLRELFGGAPGERKEESR